jgi:hypothetical protein
MGDIVPPYFSSKCPSGESYEVVSAENAYTMPPEGYYTRWRRPA